jgi:hypothetical protein
MNDSEMQIAIAKACGWTEIEECTCHNRQFRGFEPNPGQHKKHTPDYLNDLNAMHEAEKTLSDVNRWNTYRKNLAWRWATNDDDGMWAAINATARQRAEAFLKTLNLWKP